MEELIKLGSGYIALCVEAVAAVMIAYGTIEALLELVPHLAGRRPIHRRRDVRMQFGGWLLLSLEFELAADIVRTAISPTWTAEDSLYLLDVTMPRHRPVLTERA